MSLRSTALAMPVCLLVSLAVQGLRTCGAAEAPASRAAAAAVADKADPAGVNAATIDFGRDIRPVFEKHCVRCHGTQKQEGGLRLTSRAAVLAGGDSGKPPIVPGKPGESRLLRAVSGKEADLQMPPEDENDSLSPDELGRIARWIAEGAVWPEEHATAVKPMHWAWQKITRPAVPKVEGNWARNEIDPFVLAALDRAGLQPSLPADSYTLARRAALDVTGLPPTLAESNMFVADTSAAAYERLLDRLLAQPSYGERWATLWLDLARYADSKGYGGDRVRVMWRYRDWVIDSLNDNMPFDEFTVEQLAGDLLPRATPEQILATAFHRNTMSNNEGGVDDEEYRFMAVRDRAETTMQIWMGLTFGCARCHSHKFDPVSQREYYQCLAFFDQSEDANNDDETPTATLPLASERKRIVELKQQLGGLAAAIAKAQPQELPPLKQRQAALVAERKEINARNLPIAIMRELPPEKRRLTHVRIKGNYLALGEPVEPDVPAAFNPFPKDAPRNRLGLARWLVDRKNPLTARVVVNRIWARLFGRGLVESEEDFGTQGSKPSHPELLDWLASDFMRDWDQKRLIRTIINSATYRQSSLASPEQSRQDPANQMLARGPRMRLDAEFVRDQALAVSGLLCRKMGGPSVYPYQPDGVWRFYQQTGWPTSKGDDLHRRSVYTFWRRLALHPAMGTFDAPTREVCTLRRRPTNTPLQALATLNDPIFVEAAQALARRIMREAGPTPHERAAYALRLCLAQPARESQTAALVELYESVAARYREQPAEAVKLATEPLGPLPAGMSAAELAAWTVVGNVVLNLDGVLSKS